MESIIDNKARCSTISFSPTTPDRRHICPSMRAG